MKVHVEMEGRAAIARALVGLRFGAIAQVKEAVTETAEIVERKAKARVPTKSGKTRRSIRIIYRDGGLSATVGTAYWVARFIHNGTMPHKIKSKKHKAIEFEVGGEAMVRGSVNHPGVSANPFLFVAYVEERGKYLNRVGDALRQGVRIAGK